MLVKNSAPGNSKVTGVFWKIEDTTQTASNSLRIVLFIPYDGLGVKDARGFGNGKLFVQHCRYTSERFKAPLDESIYDFWQRLFASDR